MAKHDHLTPALVRALIDYDPSTGLCMWRERTPEMLIQHGVRVPRNLRSWNRSHAGTEALISRDKDGYPTGSVLGKRLRAHRVAWAVYHGEWPPLMLDHINGDVTDNRISNLRLVDAVENGRNSHRKSNNASGQTGVHWRASKGRWRARIVVKGRKIELGEFADFSAAVDARKAAEKEHGFSPRHGSPR